VSADGDLAEKELKCTAAEEGKGEIKEQMLVRTAE